MSLGVLHGKYLLNQYATSFISFLLPLILVITKYYSCVQTLINWRCEIINSFKRDYEDRRLSNAMSENINSRVRAYLGLVRGTTNFIRFKKRILLATNKKIYYAISDRLQSNKTIGKKRGKYKK